jgi:hypothetical protein
MQVGRAGSDAQVNRTREILEDTRRKIHWLLAEDDQPTED